MLRLLWLRFLPTLTAVMVVGVALLQWRYPFTYPWPWVVLCVWYVGAAVMLAWRHLSWREGWQQMIPSIVMVGAGMLGSLMATTLLAKLLLAVTVAGLAFFFLELLFLSVYAPSRYPVNGLSRLNIALIPLALFCIAATMSGLSVFIQFSRWILLGGTVLTTMILFYVTSHPSAHRAHRLRWGALGGAVGLHIGVLSFLLPVSMAVQGALSALLVVLPLRLRRYAYQPRPTMRVTWVESGVGLSCFLIVLVIARWT